MGKRSSLFPKRFTRLFLGVRAFSLIAAAAAPNLSTKVFQSKPLNHPNAVLILSKRSPSLKKLERLSLQVTCTLV
jgi:hypothetical protein